MEQRKEFGEGILYIFSNYIYNFMVTNFFFAAANVVFLFFFMTLIQSVSNSLLYYLALIPAGPAISALLYSMDKLARTGDLSPVHDFAYGYKSNLKQTLLIWASILTVLFILVIDIVYMRQSASLVNVAFSAILLVFLAIWVLVSLNALIINSRFSFRKRDLFKISAFYIVKTWKTTLANTGLLLAAAVLLSITIDFLLLFAFSLLAYFIMKQSRPMLKDVEENFIQSQQHTLYKRKEAIS